MNPLWSRLWHSHLVHCHYFAYIRYVQHYEHIIFLHFKFIFWMNRKCNSWNLVRSICEQTLGNITVIRAVSCAWKHATTHTHTHPQVGPCDKRVLGKSLQAHCIKLFDHFCSILLCNRYHRMDFGGWGNFENKSIDASIDARLDLFIDFHCFLSTHSICKFNCSKAFRHAY